MLDTKPKASSQSSLSAWPRTRCARAPYRAGARRPRGAAEWERIAAEVERSVARREARAARRPAIGYPPELPVAQRADEIARRFATIRSSSSAARPARARRRSCRRSASRAGRGERGLIGHTQPRRIAARAVATRIAQELGHAPGTVVGYKVRFTRSHAARRVRQADDRRHPARRDAGRSAARAYDTIIIDEAHERSLNIDFLLGYLQASCCRAGPT